MGTFILESPRRLYILYSLHWIVYYNESNVGYKYIYIYIHIRVNIVILKPR